MDNLQRPESRRHAYGVNLTKVDFRFEKERKTKKSMKQEEIEKVIVSRRLELGCQRETSSTSGKSAGVQKSFSWCEVKPKNQLGSGPGRWKLAAGSSVAAERSFRLIMIRTEVRFAYSLY